MSFFQDPFLRGGLAIHDKGKEIRCHSSISVQIDACDNLYVTEFLRVQHVIAFVSVKFNLNVVN